jgi:hypothetical protein
METLKPNKDSTVEFILKNSKKMYESKVENYTRSTRKDFPVSNYPGEKKKKLFMS